MANPLRMRPAQRLVLETAAIGAAVGADMNLPPELLKSEPALRKHRCATASQALYYYYARVRIGFKLPWWAGGASASSTRACRRCCRGCAFPSRLRSAERLFPNSPETAYS